MVTPSTKQNSVVIDSVSKGNDDKDPLDKEAEERMKEIILDDNDGIIDGEENIEGAEEKY